MEDGTLVISMMMLMVNVMIAPTQPSRSMQYGSTLYGRKSIGNDKRSASVSSPGSVRVKTGGDQRHSEGCSGFQIFKMS